MPECSKRKDEREAQSPRPVDVAADGHGDQRRHDQKARNDPNLFQFPRPPLVAYRSSLIPAPLSLVNRHEIGKI